MAYSEDPARIAPTLAQIGLVWMDNPRLRLGQIIQEALTTTKDRSGQEMLLYYIEDDQLLRLIQAAVKAYPRETVNLDTGVLSSS